MNIICLPEYKKIADTFLSLWDAVTEADVDVSFVKKSFPHPEEYSVECGENEIVFSFERVRSGYYAVYHYFEKAYGVSYHWDGDIFPEKTHKYKKVNIHTYPRFEYRGLRYFAHRGLYRFQAEDWDVSTWEKELDWLLKKRFNMLMLRIGAEDIFPLAFPEICPFDELDGGSPDRHGFDDRTPIYSLYNRYETRKAVSEMARERDLIQPTDCGTMTHWYSRTPKSFLESEKPTFLSQTTSVYADKGGLVWDIRDDKNLENYFKLTESYTENFGDSGLFHTIGLAERLFSADRDENLRLKKYTYERICRFLKEKHPNSKLLIGSWDFSFYWQNDEVRELLEQLDKEQCIIFDYTSDTTDEHTNFLTWGVVNNFPYIFGIFHAYEPSNGIRGDYERIQSRLDIAKSDPACIGFVTWQELSHGDNFLLEYLSANAWEPVYTREKLLPVYCQKRFGSLASQFENIYNTLYPVTRLFVWGGDKTNPQNNFFNDYTYDIIDTNITRTPIKGKITNEKYKAALQAQLYEFEAVKQNALTAGELLKAVEPSITTEQQKREWFDLERSRLSALTHFKVIEAGLAIDRLALGADNGDETKKRFREVLNLQTELTELLSRHPDYSIAQTVNILKQNGKVNPYFLSRSVYENTGTEYCRTCIYEVMRDVTLKETEAVIDWVERVIGGEADGDGYDDILISELKSIAAAYIDRKAE